MPFGTGSESGAPAGRQNLLSERASYRGRKWKYHSATRSKHTQTGHPGCIPNPPGHRPTCHSPCRTGNHFGLFFALSSIDRIPISAAERFQGFVRLRRGFVADGKHHEPVGRGKPLLRGRMARRHSAEGEYAEHVRSSSQDRVFFKSGLFSSGYAGQYRPAL